MMNRVWKYLLFVLLIIISSCVDEYWPEMDKYEDLLVVDGMITNEPGPYSITLTRSSNVNAPQFVPFMGCQIIIIDDLGNEEEFIESVSFPGTYTTDHSDLRGIVGRKYRIEIRTPDEKSYATPFEELNAPLGIDSVYALVENKPHDVLTRDRIGYQFYINTVQAETDTNYFLWKLIETFEYRSDFTIEYTYSGSIEEFANWDTLYTCWRTQQIHNIYTTNTRGLSSPVISGFPLHYVDTETKKLSIRYSLEVKQLSITDDAYFFWDNIKDQVSESGALFTKQPFQVRSNVTNIANPDEPVLGYFLVAGETRKRIFVDPPVGEYFYYPTCTPIFDLRGLYYASSYSWPIYITSIDGRMALGGDGCFDCTIYGGVTERPEWWTY